MAASRMEQYRNQYWVVRHGESTANVAGLIVSHPDNGVADFGLTSLGVEQVTEAARKASFSAKTKFITSDFLRAKETAEILQSVAGAEPPRQEKGLRERDFGILELQAHTRYQDVWREDALNASISSYGAEGADAVLLRVLNLITLLEAQFNQQEIVLVAHGDVLQIALAHHAGLTPFAHRELAPLQNAELRALVPGKK